MRLKLIVLLTFLILLPTLLVAQNITVSKIHQLNQLPVNVIHRIVQDAEGFMWYATSDGLCRDDGYSVQVFRSDLNELNLMQSNSITCIAEDKQDKIWFGTEKGLYVLDKSTYQITEIDNPRLQGRRIKLLYVTSDGSIWVSIDKFLLRYNPDKSLLREYPVTVGGEYPFINCIFETAPHHLLLAIWEGGLCMFDTETGKLTPFPSMKGKNNPTWIIRDKSHNYYWVGTWDNGIVRFDPEAAFGAMYMYQQLPLNASKKVENIVFSIVQDDTFGYLWAIGNSDLFVFVPKDGMLKQIETSSIIPQINKMLNWIIKDRAGNLWVAGFDQESFIIHFNENMIKGYKIPSLTQRINFSPAITSLCEDDDHTFWFSQARFGLCVYQPVGDRLMHFSDCPEVKSLPLFNVPFLEKSHRKGKIWAAPSNNSTVYGLRQENLTICLEETVRLQDTHKTTGTISALYEDLSDNLWIGTDLALFVYHIPSGKVTFLCDTIGTITDITETADSRIWVCTKEKGLYQIKNNNVQFFYKLTSNVSSISAASDGRLWLGSDRGSVISIDPNTKAMKDYSRDCGMNGDAVNKIVVDHYNHLWIFTNRKLTEFNPDNGASLDYLASDESFQLNRFLPNAVSVNASGDILFGGIPGFCSIQPSQRLEGIPKQVKLLITDVKVMGRSILLSDSTSRNTASSIKIASYDQNIEIDFSSLNHTNASKIRYAYRLSDVDNDWVYVQNGNNKAFYNQLSKGTYTFEVKATDDNGLWSSNITQLTIHRLPAFYETWWAYVLYVLIITSFIGSLLYMYLQRLKQKHKTQLVEQLSDMKLRYFTNISHDLLTPLTILSCVTEELSASGSSDKKMIGMLRSNVSRLKRLLQQVLDYRKMEKGNMQLHLSYGDVVQFVRDICYSGFTPIIKKKEIQFSISSDADKIEAFFDADKLDKILYNLLSNAFKYTPAGKMVWLNIKTEERNGHTSLNIEVGDNGVGIAPKEADKIFNRFYNNTTSEVGMSNGIGLSMAKELTELHHGSIHLKSELGESSVFTLEIPIDKESYPETLLADIMDAGNGVVAPVVLSTDYASAEKPLLLIVEDNEELLTLMQSILSRHYTVITAKNGVEALDIISKSEADIVVSDVMMPEMDGLELCRRLKNEIRTSHIAVILLTAKNQTDDRVVGYKVGADAYMEKPFEIQVLEALIENLLLKREQRQKGFKTNVNVKISDLEFTSLDQHLLEKAVKVVEANLTDPEFDVEVLSSKVNMSRSTLSRKIKTMTGLTPLEFTRNIKMKHACHMLDDNKMTISEIAAALGYTNRKYFTACFKEEFGKTPSDYQKENE